MYTCTTLANGLRVATESLPGMDSTTVAVTVGVGARFEHENEGGLSHMLEHMAFKGTKRRNARVIAEEMDMVGGNMNAYTSLETTVYYARILKDDVPLAVDMLADILQHSIFDEDELKREQNVILQEIAMVNDTPDDLIQDYFNEMAYPEQPIGRSILGSANQVMHFSRKDILHYMHKHYHTPSMVISAAGNIHHDSFAHLVSTHFTELSTASAPPALRAHYRGGEKRIRRKLEQLHVMLGFKAVSYNDDDYYAYQVLATLLGGGMSSRLFQEVREKRGLAYTVHAFISSYADSGMISIYAATAEDKGAELLPVLFTEVATLQKGVTGAELLRAKNQIKAGLFMSRESTSGIAEWIGRHIIGYGRYKPASELAAAIDAVTAHDIVRISTDLAACSRPTLTILGPHKRLPKYEALCKNLRC